MFTHQNHIVRLSTVPAKAFLCIYQQKVASLKVLEKIFKGLETEILGYYSLFFTILRHRAVGCSAHREALREADKLQSLNTRCHRMGGSKQAADGKGHTPQHHQRFVQQRPNVPKAALQTATLLQHFCTTCSGC